MVLELDLPVERAVPGRRGSVFDTCDSELRVEDVEDRDLVGSVPSAL